MRSLGIHFYLGLALLVCEHGAESVCVSELGSQPSADDIVAGRHDLDALARGKHEARWQLQKQQLSVLKDLMSMVDTVTKSVQTIFVQMTSLGYSTSRIDLDHADMRLT